MHFRAQSKEWLKYLGENPCWGPTHVYMESCQSDGPIWDIVNTVAGPNQKGNNLF